jgi:glycosyltransferase involved in cell wall biosynthesis
MRIGLDLQSVVGQPTGVGQYSFYLGKYLPSVSPSDDFIGLVFGGRADAALKLRTVNFTVRRVRFLPPRGVSLLWKTVDWPPADLFTGRVDVFHFPSFVARRLRSGIPAVTIHDLAFKRMPELCEAGNVAFLEKHIPRTLERAGLVLADSQFTARELVDVYGYPEERIRVVYLGVDKGFHAAGQREVDRVRRRHELPEKFILFVSTIEPRKNIGSLLQAYGLLRESAISLPQLLIVGEGGWRSEMKNIERLIEKLGLGKVVRVINYVGHDELPAVYTAAELFVFPSLYEGFGLPPLESMACGTPVVCSNSASLPEVVGDAALLVPPQDVEGMAKAMHRILDDVTLREELIRRGLKRVRKFTWVETARATIQAYRCALTRRV